MNATQKYLHAMRAVWIRDTEELSNADLSAMLGVTGIAADPAKQNPNPPWTSGEFVELLSIIIEQWNRRLAAAAEVFGLDLARMQETAEVAEQDGLVDRATANMVALERELSRRGPTSRTLTRWILENAECIQRLVAEKGLEQAKDEIANCLKSNPDYAAVVRHYFEPEREAENTDRNLAACCVLCGFDHELIVERAGIIEFDGGESRTTAAMRAAWFAFQKHLPQISEYEIGCFFDSAASMLEQKQTSGILTDGVSHVRTQFSRFGHRDKTLEAG